MINFLEGLVSQFPLPSWVLTVVFGILAVYYFSCLLIKGIRFFDRTNKVCDSYESIEGKLDSMGKKHGTLIEKFNTLIATLAEKQALEHPDVFTVNSPIQLNQKGRDLVREMGWEDSLEQDVNRKTLFDLLDKFKLKTKYDVEKYAIVLLTELAGMRTENPYTPVKKYLYEHADINDFKALTACAISLRDKYLKEHPEIKE